MQISVEKFKSNITYNLPAHRKFNLFLNQNNQEPFANQAARRSIINEKYYLQNFLAYTEDHILVTNVYFYSVEPQISPQMLLSYFETLGNVTIFHLKNDTSKKKGMTSFVKRGCVLFDSPYGAANLLKCTDHHLNGTRFMVKPNYNWNRSDQCAPSSSELESGLPLALDALNDHCLKHIIRLLSLPDRINFARTCPRFRNIYKQVSSVLDKSIDLRMFLDMTEWDVLDFFILSGSFVHELRVNIPGRHCPRLYQMIGVHCTNLRTLDILLTLINIDDMNKMFVNKDQLQKLRLINCGIKDHFLPILKKLEHLKSLDLSGNEELSGITMDQLPATIESLTLTRCRKINHKLLLKTCKTLPKLKALCIMDTYLGSAITQVISDKCCEYVEVVSMNTLDDNAHIHVAELPSLKKLTIKSSGKFEGQEDLWSSLVKHKSMQLEFLDVKGEHCINADVLSKISQLSALRTLILPKNISINDNGMEHLCALQELEEISLKYCSNVSNNAVLRLIMNCPKLQVLNLEGCSVSNQLLTDIIIKLRRQIQQKEIQRPLPIKLYIYYTGIDANCLSIPEVASKEIVEVLW